MIRDFHQDLAASNDPIILQRVTDFLHEQYQGADIIWDAGGKNDGGTDVTVVHGDRAFNYDLKLRAKDFGKNDVALEIWSNIDAKKIGWTLDATKNTDFVLWHWADSNTFYEVPFYPLREAFTVYKDEWIYGCQMAEQKNNGYRSLCMFVPIETVQTAVNFVEEDFTESTCR